MPWPHARDATPEEPTAGANASESCDRGIRLPSIRGAAERIGRVHRARGAKAAYELVENCYKTHSLASTYGEGFESCIAQDYLETRTLIQVYSRMPPEALEKQSACPRRSMLADSMGQRISMAFGHYKKSQAYADEREEVSSTSTACRSSSPSSSQRRSARSRNKNTQEKKQ